MASSLSAQEVATMERAITRGSTILANVPSQLFVSRAQAGSPAYHFRTSDRDEWQYTGITGALCFVVNNGVHYFKVLSLTSYKELFSVEVYYDLDYQRLNTHFHCFEADDCIVGFNLGCDKFEADNFHKSVMVFLPTLSKTKKRSPNPYAAFKGKRASNVNQVTEGKRSSAGVNGIFKRVTTRTRSRSKTKKPSRDSNNEIVYDIEDLSPEWKNILKSAGIKKKDLAKPHMQSLIRDILERQNLHLLLQPQQKNPASIMFTPTTTNFGTIIQPKSIQAQPPVPPPRPSKINADRNGRKSFNKARSSSSPEQKPIRNAANFTSPKERNSDVRNVYRDATFEEMVRPFKFNSAENAYLPTVNIIAKEKPKFGRELGSSNTGYRSSNSNLNINNNSMLQKVGKPRQPSFDDLENGLSNINEHDHEDIEMMFKPRPETIISTMKFSMVPPLYQTQQEQFANNHADIEKIPPPVPPRAQKPRRSNIENLNSTRPTSLKQYPSAPMSNNPNPSSALGRVVLPNMLQQRSKDLKHISVVLPQVQPSQQSNLSSLLKEKMQEIRGVMGMNDDKESVSSDWSE